MGSCWSNQHAHEDENVTYITYSDLLQDLDDFKDDLYNFSHDENDKSTDGKNLSFKVRLSKFKGKMFWEDKWFITIHVDNPYQTILIKSEEWAGDKEIYWNLDQTFFFKEKYKNFKSRYFTFKIKKNITDEISFATLKVDLMTITTGPFLYSVKLNHLSKRNQIAGILSFKVEVEQLEKLTLSLWNMNWWMLGADEPALNSSFRIVTYEDSLNSEKSKTVPIEIISSHESYQSKFRWDTLTENGKDLSLELITSIESMKSSSLQLWFWRDRNYKKYEDIREGIYKRFLSSDTEDFTDINKLVLNVEKESLIPRSNRFLKSKSKSKERHKANSQQRSVERIYSNKNAGEESIIDSGFHKSILKKIA